MDNQTEGIPVEGLAPVRPRRSKWIVISALIALVVVLVLAGIAFLVASRFGGRYPADLADYAPPDSLAFVELDLRPVIEHPEQFGDIMNSARDSSSIAKARQQLAETLRRQGIDLDKDILSWIGPVAAVAFTEPPKLRMNFLGIPGFSSPPMPQIEQEPGFLALLTARDESEAKRAVEKMVRSIDKGARRESRNGAEMLFFSHTTRNQEYICAIHNKLVLLGNNPATVVAGIDRLNGKGSRLSEVEAYRQVMHGASVKRPRMLSAYVSMEQVRTLMPKSLPESMREALAPFKAVDGIGGGISLTSKSVYLDGVTWGAHPADDPMRKALAELPPVGGRATQFLPKQTIAAYSCQNPAVLWKMTAERAANAAVAQATMGFFPLDWKAEVKRQTGLDIDRDIFDWMTGEFVIGAFETKPMKSTADMDSTGVAVVIEGEDEKTVKAALSRIKAAIPRLFAKYQVGKPFTWSSERAGVIQYDTIPLPNSSARLSIGQAGKLAIFCGGREAMQASIDAGLDAKRSVTTDKGYRSVVATLPAHPNSLYFVNIGKILDMAKDEIGNPDITSSLKTFAGSTGFIPNGQYGIAYIEVDLPKLMRGIDKEQKALDRAKSW